MSDPQISAVLAAMTPGVYERFKNAVELRKWPDGKALTSGQMQTCLQAIIAYEHHHFPPEQRTGYVPPKTEPCTDDSHIHTRETPLTWRK